MMEVGVSGSSLHLPVCKLNGYDGDGLRAWKQVGENARTYYLYDGETLLAELTPTGTLSALNTWGANGLVARWTTAGLTYYQYDDLGNVSDRLDANQAIVSSDLYDAYGVRQIGTSTDPYGYKGQYGYYTDRETGLILCTFRYYDPASGGWLTRDPIEYEGGINLYGYVGGNPVSGVDPSGLQVSIWEAKQHPTQWCMQWCLEKLFGISVATGVLNGGSAAVIPKPFVQENSSECTSVFSKGLRKLTGNCRIKSVWAPTLANLASKTTSLGGAIARWLGGIGILLTVAEIAAIIDCTKNCLECSNGKARPYPSVIRSQRRNGW